MFDPDSLLERLETLWRSTRNAKAARRVELYARTAIRLRVRTEGTGPAVVEQGHDVGLAVRAVDSSGRIGFAAASGLDPQAVELALSEATTSPGAVIDPPWSTGGEVISRDHDDATALPEAATSESTSISCASIIPSPVTSPLRLPEKSTLPGVGSLADQLVAWLP